MTVGAFGCYGWLRRVDDCRGLAVSDATANVRRQPGKNDGTNIRLYTGYAKKDRVEG